MMQTIENRRSVEAAVIGAMVLFDGQEAAEFAAGELTGTEFSCPDLRIQFQTVCDMLTAGTPFDALTLGNELSSRGKFEAAGGASVIAEVLEAVPHAAHIRLYVEQLQAMHKRDCLGSLSDRLRMRAQDLTVDPGDTVDAILNELETLKAGKVQQDGLIAANDALKAYDERNDDHTTMIATGLRP